VWYITFVVRGDVGIGRGEWLSLEGWGLQTFTINFAYDQVRRD